jgi:hypothetical protein
MDQERVLKLFKRHPKLEILSTAGTISNKAAREILDIDRWLMNEVYLELIEAGAVVSVGSSLWRAKKELQEFVAQRREQRNEIN